MSDFEDLQRILQLEAEVRGLKELVVELQSRNQFLEERNRHLEERKSIDELTGVHSRFAFDERLEEEVELARREIGIPLTLVLFDLDHFKTINDDHGHQAGDDVLRNVGRVVREHARSSDFVARVGGEEFALILLSTSIESAMTLVERLKDNIASHEIVTGGKTVPVTASFGVAEWNVSLDVRTLYERADKMLYAAKRSGRNCVVQHV
jgi:diguanylate cyclase (GGDEF)-like protein